ncbi:MAG: amidohydrolase family protein [Halieaceae bacterium]|nr:amidohydrolase family protein [Halieaceae bacterium]
MKMRSLCWSPFVLVLVLAGCGSAVEPSQIAASTPKPMMSPQEARVFSARAVITMDAGNTIATAVAVQGERIVAVGSRESIRQALPDYRLVHDEIFADKVIMPGFIDNHLHPALAGLLVPSRFITPFDWDLPNQQVKGLEGREAYLKRLNEIEHSYQDPEEVLITWGYHEYFHGNIVREDLNAISATRPIIVWQRSFHEIVVNDAALARLGIHAEEFGGHPMIDLEKGRFWETGLFAIFGKLQSIVLAPERFRSGVLNGLEHARRNGITTFCDQGVPLLNLDMEMQHLEAVINENDLPLRALMIANAKSLGIKGDDAALQFVEKLPQRSNETIQYLPKQIKLLADGAFYSQLMQMEDGYLDGHHGEWIMTPEQLETAARVYWNADYQLHIHVNGDKGVNVILDLIEKLQQEYAREDHQTVLHHFGYSAEAQSKRIAELGVLVSANPYYLWALGDKYSEIGLGPERAHFITRLGSLERHGVPVSLHSDLPMAPAAPLILASVAASRLSAGGNLLGPGERLSVDTALRGITIEAARAIQQQDSIGSIEIGKLADFTVLEQNPYAVPTEKLGEIPVWGTVFGGQPRPRITDDL